MAGVSEDAFDAEGGLGSVAARTAHVAVKQTATVNEASNMRRNAVFDIVRRSPGETCVLAERMTDHCPLELDETVTERTP